jgi:hypothetical protein
LALTFLTDWPLSKVKDYNNFSTWMTKQLNSNGVVNFDVDVRNKVIAESKKFSFSQKEGKKENIWIT